MKKDFIPGLARGWYLGVAELNNGRGVEQDKSVPCMWGYHAGSGQTPAEDFLLLELRPCPLRGTEVLLPRWQRLWGTQVHGGLRE